jgi:hypothetical protein
MNRRTAKIIFRARITTKTAVKSVVPLLLIAPPKMTVWFACVVLLELSHGPRDIQVIIELNTFNFAFTISQVPNFLNISV